MLWLQRNCILWIVTLQVASITMPTKVWEQLKVGTVLKLERDKENRTDAHPENQVHLTIRIKRNVNNGKEA